MATKMRRGRRQVILNYLPGRVFDFSRISTIAQIRHIRGIASTELNKKFVLRAVDSYVRSWPEAHRMVLRDTERTSDRFVLVKPISVEASLFPMVYWCQNSKCGRVIDRSSSEEPLRDDKCPFCNVGRLVQLRWVRIHRCGALRPLIPPTCPRCKSSREIALDTRGSERLAGFRWECRKCGWQSSVLGGKCPECSSEMWKATFPGDDKAWRMDVEIFRAGRTYFPHHVVLLNQPTKAFGAFLSQAEWPAVAAASFLNFQELSGQKLEDYGRTKAIGTQHVAITQVELELLKQKGMSDEDIKRFKQMTELLQTAQAKEDNGSPSNHIETLLVERTGVSAQVWERAGQEMLEAVAPLQSGSTTEVTAGSGHPDGRLLSRLGLGSVTLVNDFPITLATFGYSRADYKPGTCALKAFPADTDHGGKFPIFVDLVQADAIMVRLDHERVLRWLEANGCSVSVPNGADVGYSRKAYFVRLLDGLDLGSPLTDATPDVKLVFGLLHTLSHLAVRRAALLCGLDQTSLAEYILPRTLSFVVYSNHRSGATIGALTSLFEQSMHEWLGPITSESRRCVYDPVCRDRAGSCHACTHLSETSCRYFNQNLSRAFLFGGPDFDRQPVRVGYLDPILQ